MCIQLTDFPLRGKISFYDHHQDGGGGGEQW